MSSPYVWVIPDMEAPKVLVGDQPIPASFTMWFDRPHEGPRVVLQFAVDDGVPLCHSIEFNGRGRGVTSTDLRAIKIEDLLETAVQQAVLWSDSYPIPDKVLEDDAALETYVDDREAMLRDLVKDTRSARRNARRRIGPHFLTEVARVYRANVDGNPTMAVAEFTGRAHRTAALYIKQAREAGLLGAASPGKKGER